MKKVVTSSIAHLENYHSNLTLLALTEEICSLIMFIIRFMSRECHNLRNIPSFFKASNIFKPETSK